MSATQIQAILSNADSFADLISKTLSQDNATRRTAEDLYTQLKQQRPDAVAANLLQLLVASSDSIVRSTCAVFLRKFFKPAAKEVGWAQLNRTTKTLAKQKLLEGISAEQDRAVAKQMADAAVVLGAVVLEKGDAKKWPELLSALQGWIGSQVANSVAREAALQIISGMSWQLLEYSGQLAPVILGCLGTPPGEGSGNGPEVQVAALKAVLEFLRVLRKPKDLRPYQAALPAALAALQHVISYGKLAAAESILTDLIQSAEVEPGLWQPYLRTAIPGMLSLAGSGTNAASLPEELQRLAAEFVLTLLDVKPQMMMTELGPAALSSQLVAAVAHFLTSGIEEDAGWGDDPMASPALENDDTLGEMHRYGMESARRAAAQLDSGAMLRAVVDMTAAWARDASDWRRRHAVLMCLSQAVGECVEVVGSTEVESLAGLLVNALSDAHPRVRWAACYTIGIFSDDVAPELQLGKGGAPLLKALTELLSEPDSPSCPQRLKAEACGALVAFLDGLDKEEVAAVAEAKEGADEEAAVAAAKQRVKELLLPFLEPLSAPLLAQVERCAAGEGGSLAGGRALVPTPLQEYSLDVLTRLAVCLGSDFAPVFPIAMPRVMAVLARAAPFHPPSAASSGAVTEEEASAIVRVQVGSLECAAFMCRSAGPAAAAEHVPSLVAMLGLLCRPDIESGSPLLLPLLNAMEPLASCLGPEARHLLGPALPLLVQWASKDVGLKVLDDKNDEEGGATSADKGDDSGSDDDSERDDSDYTVLEYGDVSYRCTETVLAAKTAATSALEELVVKMGSAIVQQVAILADALMPRLLEYYLGGVHSIVRRALPQLLRNYLAALSQGSLLPNDPAASAVAAQALLHRIWQTLTLVIHPGGAQSDAAARLLPNGTKRPTPTTATRADMIEVLTQIVDSVEGSMLQQSWVSEAFAALQAAVTAAQKEVEDESSEDDDEEPSDKSMEADGSVDLEAEGSDAEEEDEEEYDGEETEDDESESPEQARERLREQVESCVAAFTRKYGDAVSALAQSVLSTQPAWGGLVNVRNGMVG